MSGSIDADRLALGDAALLSVSRAAELLPGRDSKNRKLIEDAGLVRRLGAGGVRCVRWGDCQQIATLERQPEPESVKTLRRRKKRRTGRRKA